MKLHVIATALVGLCLAASAGAADNELTPAEKADGWKLLFDGKTATGWVNHYKDKLETWAVEDGALVRKDNGSDTVYKAEQFENFLLAIDWKIADKGNSGVFLRMSSEQDWINTGMEVQILDLNEAGEMSHPSHVAGALYDLVAPPAEIKMKPGEWNHFDIVCDGPKVSCKMNGVQTFAIDESEEKWQKPQGKFNKALATLPRKGWLMLQDHHSRVEFKNIKIKVLPDSAPAK